MKHLTRTAACIACILICIYALSACCSIMLIDKNEKQKGNETASAQYTPTTQLQQTATI